MKGFGGGNTDLKCPIVDVVRGVQGISPTPTRQNEAFLLKVTSRLIFDTLSKHLFCRTCSRRIFSCLIGFMIESYQS